MVENDSKRAAETLFLRMRKSKDEPSKGTTIMQSACYQYPISSAEHKGAIYIPSTIHEV